MARTRDDLPVSAPDWIVTFSDMISLLVTFFILLMTFSSLDNHEAFLVRGNIGGTLGLLQDPAGPSAPTPPHEDLMAAIDVVRGAQTPHSRPPAGLPDDIEDMGQRLSEEHIEIDLNDVADGLLIRFGPRAAFAPGSAEVNPHLARALGEMGRALQHYPHLIAVEGHTETSFTPSPRFPTSEDLALARAQAAARVLLASSELHPTLVQVAGMGDAYPLAPSTSPRGRAENRRVEIRVLSLSRTRQAELAGGPR